jgi:hypothetical protein
MVVETTNYLEPIALADNMPYAEGDKRVANITSLSEAEPQNIKDAFNEEVDFLGANIILIQMAYASGLSKYLKEYYS